MPCPLLTPTVLANGITNFLSHPKWRKDFHNLFYSTITQTCKMTGNFGCPSAASYKPAGHYGPTIWHDTVGELQYWKALRPYANKYFISSPRVATLQNAYASIGIGLPYPPVPVANPPQSSIKDLFVSAEALKPLSKPSAVFPSKCCHMLCPWEFPVWDNSFAGNVSATRLKMLRALKSWPDLDVSTKTSMTKKLLSKAGPSDDYWTYREFILLAWDTLPSPNKTTLIAIMDKTIMTSSAHPVWRHYPYRTKIPELCLS